MKRGVGVMKRGRGRLGVVAGELDNGTSRHISHYSQRTVSRGHVRAENVGDYFPFLVIFCHYESLVEAGEGAALIPHFSLHGHHHRRLLLRHGLVHRLREIKVFKVGRVRVRGGGGGRG